jgi:prepilin-type N-terminal cleavage/methylation domain-containing protein
MLNRRGVTLVELLVTIVLLSIVGLVSARVLTSMLRVTTAQVQLTGAQSTARTGALAIPQELREVGYDTIPGIGTNSDLEAIAANRITFRAMRGMGVTCALSFPVTGITEVRIRKPVLGLRTDGPLLTDSLRIFVENDVNRGDDDQWVSLTVTAIDPNSTCGADSAIRLTIDPTPKHTPPAGDEVDATDAFVGGPVRWYERMEYGPVIDATTGRAYVGARSLSLGQNTLLPIIGPLNDTTGFALTYYAADGTVLDPAVAPHVDVRSIGVSLTGSTAGPIALSGSSTRSRANLPVFTRVALRNNLRPDP